MKRPPLPSRLSNLGTIIRIHRKYAFNAGREVIGRIPDVVALTYGFMRSNMKVMGGHTRFRSLHGLKCHLIHDRPVAKFSSFTSTKHEKYQSNDPT